VLNLTLMSGRALFSALPYIYETYKNLWRFIWRMERHVILWSV
jgi:hypothetical protein